MGMSLYEIDSRIKEILDNIYDAADENGEVGEIDLTELKELQEARETKLENIALYAKNLASEASAIKEEENTLSERRKRLERKCERMKGILINAMKEDGNKKLSSARFEAVLRDSKKTEIIDESLIPEQYINTKIEKSPDKTAIKKAIEAGEEVAGATVITNTTISIK